VYNLRKWNITLKLEQYNSLNYPPAGKHIMAQTHGDTIVVYQAYKKTTADFATQHQKFGGPILVSIVCRGSNQISCG